MIVLAGKWTQLELKDEIAQGQMFHPMLSNIGHICFFFDTLPSHRLWVRVPSWSNLTFFSIILFFDFVYEKNYKDKSTENKWGCVSLTICRGKNGFFFCGTSL
jgi:hypothetical protein